MEAVYLSTHFLEDRKERFDINEQKKMIIDGFKIQNKKDVNLMFVSDENVRDNFYERAGIKKILSQKKKVTTIYIYEYWVLSDNFKEINEIIRYFRGKGIIFKTIKKQYIGAYIRVSTEKQVKEGESIDAQKHNLFKHIYSLGLVETENEIKFYIDDGFTGSNTNRPAFQSMLDDIKNEFLVFLYSYDLQRIGRNIDESRYFLKLIKQKSTCFSCLKEEIIDDRASDRVSVNVRLVFNEYEREKVIERTNDTLIAIAESKRYPCGGKIFFGYYRGEDKNIYIHETNGEIIKKIVELGKKAVPLKEIKDYANEIQDEYHFTIPKIREIFMDHRYAGIFKYKGKIYNDIIPALVSVEDLQQALKYCGRERVKDEIQYFFSQKIFCSKCDSKMTGTHGTGKSGKKYYYYVCKTCQKKVSQQKIELQISNLLRDVDSTEIEKVIKKISRIKQKIRTVKDLYLNDQINETEYCSLAITLEEGLKELKLKKSAIVNISNKKVYGDMVTNEEKKTYVENTFRKIVVNTSNSTIEDITFVEKI